MHFGNLNIVAQFHGDVAEDAGRQQRSLSADAADDDIEILHG